MGRGPILFSSALSCVVGLGPATGLGTCGLLPPLNLLILVHSWLPRRILAPGGRGFGVGWLRPQFRCLSASVSQLGTEVLDASSKPQVPPAPPRRHRAAEVSTRKRDTPIPADLPASEARRRAAVNP
jgi:hypothetical protein